MALALNKLQSNQSKYCILINDMFLFRSISPHISNLFPQSLSLSLFLYIYIYIYMPAYVYLCESVSVCPWVLVCANQCVLACV